MDPDGRYHRRTHDTDTAAGVAELEQLAEAGWFFCEALDCPVYDRREDLVTQPGGELYCPTHDDPPEDPDDPDIGCASGWRAWAACTDHGRHIEDGAEVVLGFDGSFSGDCTALVAVTVADRPHVHLVRL
jgi:hypothetical protein